MKEVFLGLTTYTKAPRAVTVTIYSTLILFFLALLLQNGALAFQVLSFTSLSFFSRLTSFLTSFFDLTSAFTPVSLAVSVASSILGGVSIGMLYAYYQFRHDIFVKGGFALTGVAYAVVLLGIQCAACSTAILTTLFTVVGSVWINEHLPMHGLEIGIIGIAIQAVLIVNLVRKLAYPATC